MRKTLIQGIQDIEAPQTESEDWLDLERLASVEVTSEDERFPVEHALVNQSDAGWRAARPGPQLLRLQFDEPQEIRRIQIRIVDRDAQRTQELTLSAEMAGVGLKKVRSQQFTFSPGGSTEEFEDFQVELAHVVMVELRIDPDRSHDPAQSQSYATLSSIRIA